MIVVRDVVVNGEDFDDAWSDAPNDSGLADPDGTNGFIDWDNYTWDDPNDPDSDPDKPAKNGTDVFVWVGIDRGFTIFDRSGTGDFVGGASNWGGT
ncbi:MAG TPA: hypothetical protein VII57_07550, partial [Dehalococcoidia bacterium]